MRTRGNQPYISSSGKPALPAGRILKYDLVRIAMTFVIFVFHYAEAIREYGISSPFLKLGQGLPLTIGQPAVVVFFILAGSTSAVSFSKRLGKGDGSFARCAADYYRSRFLSIYPAFWMAWLAAYLLVLVPERVELKGYILYSLLGIDGYLQIGNAVPTFYLVGEWFLGALLALYLLFPFLYAAIRKKPVLSAAVLIAYACVIIGFYPFRRLKEINILCRVLDFSLGIFLGLYVREVSGAAAALSLMILVLCYLVRFPGDIFLQIMAAGTALYLFLLWAAQKAEGHLLKPKPVSARSRIRTPGLQKAIENISGLCYPVFLLHHVIIYQVLKPWAGEALTKRETFEKLAYTFVLVLIYAIMLRYADRSIRSRKALRQRAASV